jgi:hypothetical protein
MPKIKTDKLQNKPSISCRRPDAIEIMGDNSLEQEITKAQARNRELGARHKQLRSKFEENQRRAAYLSHLYDQNERLEREIAEMEGRHHDDDDSHQEPMPPEDMDA